MKCVKICRNIQKCCENVENVKKYEEMLRNPMTLRNIWKHTITM
jgi:hypothetical protein